MKNEIDGGFYCSAGFYKNGLCVSGFGTLQCHRKTVSGEDCGCYHRKWPAPEQFREEYGGEYPDGGAVYYRDNDFEDWRVTNKADAYDDERYQIVCACTPFGKPDDDWRPE